MMLPSLLPGSMSTTTHTPGPWFLSDEGDFLGIDAEGQNIILNSNYGEYCGVQGESREKAVANARLIVAAPDLLAACKKLADAAAECVELSDWPELREALEKADAAIGKVAPPPSRR